MACSEIGANKRYKLLTSAIKSFDLDDSKHESKDEKYYEFGTVNKRQKDIVARLEQDNKLLAELEKYQPNTGSKSFSPFNVDEITENLEINNLIKSGFKKKGLDDEENKIIVTEKSKISKESKDLEEILEKIKEDNKLLAELDKKYKKVLSSKNNLSQLSSSALPLSSNQLKKYLNDNTSVSKTFPEKKSQQSIDKNNLLIKGRESNLDNAASPITSKDLEKLMKKLEQDNRVLAELDKKVKRVSSDTGSAVSVPNLNTTLSSLTPLQLEQLISLYNSNNLQNSVSKILGPIFNQTEKEEIPMLIQQLKKNEEIADSIEIPNRGRCRVYIARYSYDPFKQSPNENPEQELRLEAGDFILISGDMDEDGFFLGELLDKRKGLVPSNFVEKLTGEDLLEFQATFLYENRDGDESNCSYPPEFYDAMLNDAMGHTNFQHLLAPEDFHRMNDYVDLAESIEIDEEDLSDVEKAEAAAARDPVPPPKRLVLERQLYKSILIGWLHPDCPRGMIDCFQIYVDGVLKVTVPGGERTKALVEGVESSMPHRISVRAINTQGRMSKDAACTIVIGKNVPFAPCCIKATNITSESALISWLPCNSNFYHVVAVNSVEVRTVGPSIYKQLITGLASNTLYRVSVRAKPGKLLCSDEKNPKKLEMLTTFVDFRTLQKSLPEPPVDIQIEAGPQEGTLLVTWLPVTLDKFGTSNGCPVTGYAVFAAHKKLGEIDSPTGDHALLDVSQLESFHKKAVTVRTKSGENLSADSMPCQIPDDLLKFSVQRKTQIQSDSESEAELIQLMNSIAKRSKLFNPSETQLHTQKQSTLARHGPQDQNQIHRVNAMNKNISNRQMQIQPSFPENSIETKELLASRMNIPAIEITKETPSESINMIESYSEEEFESSMKNKKGHWGGPSTAPPHRHRNGTEYDRSHFEDPHRVKGAYQRGIRCFVALYDYDPLTMSPNPDAADEELPFREGDLIKIHGDKDADGFYKGELNGRFGFVPCNMVSEVQYDTESGGQIKHGGSENDPWSHLPVKKMIAMYDYDPQELSPNPDADMELCFSTGNVIYVYGDMDEDGFYMGELNGVRGLVPSNFLMEAVPGDNVRHSQNRLQNDHRYQQPSPVQNQSANYYQNQSSGYQANQQQMPQSSMRRTQVPQQTYYKQTGVYGTKQRPITLDLGTSNKRVVNPTESNNQTGQQAPHTSLNPFSSLFASGKRILEEATTPKTNQSNNQGNFGYDQNSGYVQSGQKQSRSISPSISGQQQNYYQPQQQSQQGTNIRQQSQQNQQSNQGPTAAISGALGGALKSIFKI